MCDFKIGALLDSFKLETKQAIETAASLGIEGVQLYSTTGEHSPENMTKEKRHELMDMLHFNGMVVTALCGDFGMGFGDHSNNPRLIERSKRILELAKELGTNIVTTHIGVIPNDINHPRYKIMQEACAQLCEYADSLDAHFAVETGPESSSILRKFLDSLGSSGVAVNLDPANLVMVTGDNPIEAVYNLKDYIVHTHAKDGIKIKDGNPEVIYGVIDETIKSEEYFKEVPLGEGKVPFKEYLKALNEIGYSGFLTIEREVGDNPVHDIGLAVHFLQEILNKLY